MYEDLKESSAREIAELLREVQRLEDELAALGASHGNGTDADLARRVADLERRLVVRASNAIGRNALTGRAVRTLGILRRDWKEL